MLHIVPITKKHDRKSFNCGEPALNDFLLKRGLFSTLGDTYVVVPDPSSSEIIAYYTAFPDLRGIVMGNYAGRQLLSRLVKVEYLAVDERYQRQGIGTDLLVEIMRDLVKIAEEFNINALAAEPMNEKARKWLNGLNFGFEEVMMDDKKMLILPVETMRQVL